MVSLTRFNFQPRLPVMATASNLRRMNQRRIVEAMARLGRASRVELARASGISQPTVTRIVDELLSQSILMPSSEQSNGGSGAGTALGRPSLPLQLDTRRQRFAVIQVGVRKTRLAVLPIAIPNEDHWTHEFDSPVTLDQWLKKLSTAWSACRTRGLQAIVISLPGVVDEESGRVLLSPNLRWTESADFVRELKSILEHPAVIFSQEIRALALGHIAVNAGLRDFLLVDSGSGLGAAALLHGRLFDGALPLSGEIGHTPVLGNQRLCGCGAKGCSETLISRHGMMISARENGLSGDWMELLESLHKKPLPKWMTKTLECAGVTIASALNVLGVRDVVLTGAFAELPHACIAFLEQRIQADAMWGRFGTVTCKTARRHRQAGMVCLAIDRTLCTDQVELSR